MSNDTVVFMQSKDLKFITLFPEFKEIVIYGTKENPLFMKENIYKILDLPQINLIRDFVENNDYIKFKAPGKDGKFYMKNLLTMNGVYKCIFRSDAKISEKFKNYIMLVMEDLRIIGNVNLQESIEKFKIIEEEMKKIIDINKEDIDKKEKFIKNLEIQLDEEHSKIKISNSIAEKYMHQNYRLQSECFAMKDKLRPLNARINRSDEYMLNLIKERFLLKVRVIPEKLKIPKIKKDEIEFKEVEEDIDIININEDDDIYFTLADWNDKKEKRPYATIIYLVKEPDTLVKFKKYLADKKWESKKNKNFYYGCLENLTGLTDDLLAEGYTTSVVKNKIPMPSFLLDDDDYDN